MNHIIDKSGELHLFIIWNKGRHKQDDILEDLGKNLSIVEAIEVRWTKNLVRKNYARFYGLKLEKISSKIKECGTEPFLLVTVLDKAPDYQYVETSRGHERVNKNIFELKQKYRKWTNGGHKIHSTNSTTEVNHDLTLLVGKNVVDYTNQISSLWSGSVSSVSQDLVGTQDWQSLVQLFYVLNNTIEYFVMRNHEILPEAFQSKEHGDIDIQVSDFDDARIIMNAEPVYKQSYRVHYKTNINGQEVLWDIRHISDNYYCAQWQKELMDNRVINEKSIYVLSPDDYFYTLIYHAVVHKKKIAADYYTKLKDLSKKVAVKINQADFDASNNDFDVYIQYLMKHMKLKGYSYTRPFDKSVYFNQRYLLVDAHAAHFRRCFDIKNVSPTMLSYKSPSGFFYYKGDFEGTPVFIKWGRNAQAIKNEFHFADKLYKKNNKNFIRPLFYQCNNNNEAFIVFEYKKGVTLDKKIESGVLNRSEKEDIIVNFENILKELAESNCCHRDVRPENILISQTGDVILFDFQFGVAIKNYKENKYIRKKPRVVYNLGSDFAKGRLIWNDAHSFLKIIDVLCGAQSEKSAVIQRVITNITQWEPTLSVAYKYKKLTLMRIKIERLFIALVPIKSLRHSMRALD